MKDFKLTFLGKSIFLLFVYLGMICPTMTSLHSQSCSNLFISEVVFWKDIADSGPGNINHAVEVYNPTNGIIDLSEYGIRLTTSSDSSIIISLIGYINPESTYVLSNDEAMEQILLVADQSSPYFKFDGIEVLELIKIGGNILDKIGNKGAGVNLNEIDLDSLSSSNYLEQLNINIESLEFLDIRRDALIKEGDSIFDFTKDFFSKWALYGGFELGNLGIHECSCVQPVFFFYPNSLADPEEYYPEGVGPIGWEVRVTEPIPVDVIISINPNFHHFLVPNVPSATGGGVDFTFNPDLYNDITWVASTQVQYFDILTETIADGIEEGYEGGGVFLFMEDDNGTGATISQTGKYFDFVIFDPNTSVKNILLPDIKVFPTLITSLTKEIHWKTAETQKIISVAVLDSEGRLILEKKCEGCTKIDIDAINRIGLYYIQIRTNEGMVMKKILRI